MTQTPDNLADMSRTELIGLVRALIDERLALLKPDADKPRLTPMMLDALLSDMRAHIWSAPSGTPSSLGFLREDRSR